MALTLLSQQKCPKHFKAINKTLRHNYEYAESKNGLHNVFVFPVAYAHRSEEVNVNIKINLFLKGIIIIIVCNSLVTFIVSLIGL